MSLGNETGAVTMDVGGIDPALGESFASIAARSRAMHKTQGFDVGYGPAAAGSTIESFLPLAGEPAKQDILDGVDATWNRVPGGAEIGRLTEEAIAHFKPEDPSNPWVPRPGLCQSMPFRQCRDAPTGFPVEQTA